MAILEHSYVLGAARAAAQSKSTLVYQGHRPKPFTESKEWHSLSACWPQDGSAALLQYKLQDHQDGQSAWGEEGYCEVRRCFMPD